MDPFTRGFIKEASALGLTELEALHIYKTARTRPNIIRPTFTRPDIQKPSINRPGALERPLPERPQEVTPPTPPDRPPDIQPGPAMNRPPEIMRPNDVNVSLQSALHPKEVNEQLDALAQPKIAGKIDYKERLRRLRIRRGESPEKKAIYLDDMNMSNDGKLTYDVGNNSEEAQQQPQLTPEQIQQLLMLIQQSQQKQADYKSDIALEQGPNPFTGVKHNKYDVEYEGKRVASVYHKLKSKTERSGMYAEPHYENMPELKQLLNDLLVKHPELLAKLKLTPLGGLNPGSQLVEAHHKKTGMDYTPKDPKYKVNKNSLGLQPDMSKTVDKK
jgi:hypothetical protein